ncbi:hypothetical protein [Nocardioides sp.]|uniref:hypothetical protein n=1 Tax=Nocardioides sp. TaxID=35761 RepID=UPI0035B04F66
MRGDVTLVKSALLYADEVELLGLAASLVYATGMAPAASSPTLAELIELTEIVSDEVRITPEIRTAVAYIERAERKGQPLPLEWREDLESVREFRSKAGKMLVDSSEKMARNTGLWDLRPAIDARVVTVADLGLRRADTLRAVVGKSTGSDAEVKAWMDGIVKRLSDARTHLLFDQETASFVDAMVREGVVGISSAGRLLLGKAAMGAGLVAKLPTFEGASVEELLELRSDLSMPLTRYRAAVVRLSKTIPGIPVTELDAAVQAEWEASVAPALDDLSTGLIEHGLVHELSKQARLDTAAYLTLASGLFVGMDQLTDLGKLASGVAASIPAIGGTLGKASVAVGERRSAFKRHDFYYLHAADEALAK